MPTDDHSVKSGLARSRRLFGALALISFAMAGCGTSSSTASPAFPKLTITAGVNGYQLQPSAPLPAGTIELDLRNRSHFPVQFRFATPLAGVTLAQVRTTVSGNLDQLQHQVEFGLGWALPPTQAQTLYLTYQAGTNFVLSLISRGPHTPVQAAQGYLAQFTVRGRPPAGQTQPSVAGTLSVTDQSISVPSGFGKGTFALLNTDAKSAHALSFFRFRGAAKPLNEVVAKFGAVGPATGPTPPAGQPPALALGLQGLASIQPLPAYGCSCISGSRILARFALSPGTYVVLGTGFDPKTNVLEATEGIAAEFTVT